jgi:hypothetical protein
MINATDYCDYTIGYWVKSTLFARVVPDKVFRILSGYPIKADIFAAPRRDESGSSGSRWRKCPVIEGRIALAAYAHAVVADWRVDPDFVVFGALASTTDHLPFGQVRSRWSVAALARADAEIERITERNREHLRQACANLIARFSSDKRTVALYRPVGPKELELIAESGWRKFPPRLPDQPIFYPVTNEAHAIQIARDWNVKADGAGFVTKFDVDAYYLSRYQVQKDCGAIQEVSHAETGFDVLELLDNNLPTIIFVTAYDVCATGLRSGRTRLPAKAFR